MPWSGYMHCKSADPVFIIPRGIPAVAGHIVFVGRHEHSVGNTASKSIEFAQSSGCSLGGLAEDHGRSVGVLAAHLQEGSPRIPCVGGIVVRAVRILRG